MNHWEMLARIGLGTVLAGVIGYERDLHGRPAGLRTHALVGLASALFMVVSTHFVYAQHYGHDDLVEVDASRIAASVVSGIGFLAGGAILRTGMTIQGLTTAAGLWMVAAIGLAAGGGMYVESLAGTGIGFVALTLLRRFEDKDDRLLVQRRVLLTLGAGAPTVGAVVAQLEGLGVRVSQADYEKHLAEQRTTVTLLLRYANTLPSDQLLASIESLPGVVRLRLEPLQ